MGIQYIPYSRSDGSRHEREWGTPAGISLIGYYCFSEMLRKHAVHGLLRGHACMIHRMNVRKKNDGIRISPLWVLAGATYGLGTDLTHIPTSGPTETKLLT